MLNVVVGVVVVVIVVVVLVHPEDCWNCMRLSVVVGVLDGPSLSAANTR